MAKRILPLLHLMLNKVKLSVRACLEILPYALQAIPQRFTSFPVSPRISVAPQLWPKNIFRETKIFNVRAVKFSIPSRGILMCLLIKLSSEKHGPSTHFQSVIADLVNSQQYDASSENC